MPRVNSSPHHAQVGPSGCHTSPTRQAAIRVSLASKVFEPQPQLQPDHHKYRVTWPELMGAEPETAKAIIERDNPYVKAVILHREEVTRDDFCCNRVYVKLDANKRVYLVPHVG
ncbi:Serine protease inhibitor- potato inhibitor I-type family protein [Striga hermonthica]|uniref:Serine protease inhibitor- potato inhibitor I-type family protein n=1 Tax=Striga hermonthica TaxID=68872 RepID=A0A9N7RNU7_STRHE|nr:Serine protease inhibitor- potato inhibitor I-type family protein [Striga hermonthica]